MEAVIRDATLADAQAIARVHIRSWQVAYRGMIPDVVLDGLCLTDRIERWRESLQRADESVIVIEVEGRIAGWASFGRSRDAGTSPPPGELHGLYLDPNMWRKGLGSRLCAEVDKRLKEQGFTDETVWFLEANYRARKFYESIGFRDEGIRKVKIRANSETPEVRFRKRL